MVNKKAVIMCSIITLVLVIAIVGVQIKLWKNHYDSLGVANANTASASSNQVNNGNQEDLQNGLNENELDENLTNNTTEDTSNTENTSNFQGAEETTPTENGSSNNSDKAINLVKEEWGENDNAVYYTVDNQSGDIFTVSVRSKTTTVQLAEYEVNISTNEVTIK